MQRSLEGFIVQRILWKSLQGGYEQAGVPPVSKAFGEATGHARMSLHGIQANALQQ